METPSIPDSDGKFCCEMDVEVEFILQVHNIFIVALNLQLGLDTKKLQNI